MAAHSKLLHYTCYELGHTWEPSCTKAVLGVGYHALIVSFKVYAPLYLVAALLRKKNKDYFKRRLLPEILRSTVFLGTNALAFIGSFCLWRWLTGAYCFYNVFVCGIPSGSLAMLLERKDRKAMGRPRFLTVAFGPGLVACSISIMLERKSRRGLLALYLMNLATETLYRMAVFRGIVKPLWNGEVLFFSIVAAVYMYLFKSKNGLRDSIRSGIQFIVGPSEAGAIHPVSGPSPSPPSAQPSAQPLAQPLAQKQSKTILDYLAQPSEAMQKLLKSFRKGSRHILCKHKHGCVSTVVEGGLRMYTIGYIIQATVKLVGSLSQIVRRPRAPFDALLHPDNANFGRFLASFSMVHQAVCCCLRWIRNEDSELHGLLSGFLAGWSMLFYKSSSIALYLASKLAEVLWFKGVQAGKLPLIKWADVLIYTISTSIVFHAAVFEPHTLRPAYWKFLHKLTNGKFAEMNRILLDCYGTQASRLLPTWWPNYDPRYTNLGSQLPKNL